MNVRSMLRTAGGVIAAAATIILAGPDAASACGGLVGENGTIQLAKTTTLAAYADGVERYVTSFEFTGEGESVGSIVPLPGVPTAVERGGDWTLQRLAREVAPQRGRALLAGADSATSAEAEVLQTAKIDALDITILRGGGTAVGTWATENGFFLTPDAPEVLDFYASRSPIFMAAKFDAGRARSLGQARGDGTPIMLTIPTEEPWVPLRILALGLESSAVVEADVFVLTPSEPELLAGASGRRGLSLTSSQEASPSLLADLRSDKGMEWVPDDMWLSYLQVDSAAGDLDYDLAISPVRGRLPSPERAGVRTAGDLVPVSERSGVFWPLAVGAAVALSIVVVGLRRGAPGPAPASTGT